MKMNPLTKIKIPDGTNAVMVEHNVMKFNCLRSKHEFTVRIGDFCNGDGMPLVEIIMQHNGKMPTHDVTIQDVIIDRTLWPALSKLKTVVDQMLALPCCEPAETAEMKQAPNVESSTPQLPPRQCRHCGGFFVPAVRGIRNCPQCQ